MCRKMPKNSVCSVCRQSLAEESEVHAQPESTPVKCKTRGGLVHPKGSIFFLLQEAEKQFQQHATQRNAYDLTVEGLLEKHTFSFPCWEHKEDIMENLLPFYIAMRMAQVCKQAKIQSKTKMQHLRKLVGCNEKLGNMFLITCLRSWLYQWAALVFYFFFSYKNCEK